MIKLILISTLLFLMGCNINTSRGLDSGFCKEAVEAAFPGGKIMRLTPNHKFSFLVRDTNGDIWYVECLSSGPDISYKGKVFPKE